jgi:hypothetical protein
MSSPEYLRFYDETMLELARRGHDVRLAVQAVREGKPVRLDAILRAEPRVTSAGIIPERSDGWVGLARAVRGTMDFLRYLHPRLAGTPRLRARVKRQALPWTLQWLDRVRVLPAGLVNALMRGLASVERVIPPDPALVSFLRSEAPDVVLVSPLVEPASDQVDLVRAAAVAGLPTATLVASWDNLTNKGDLKVSTGMVAVWNEAQRAEARELHRVSEEAVVVTGAQAFDRWFGRRPSRTRDEFCRDVGLPPGRPFVLFTGSSIFIARADVEMPFVRRWIEALRASSEPLVRDLAVLVRPHPYNGQAWRAQDFDGLDGVAVWPRGGYDPIDEANRIGLFDSLYYCDAVVGINTSAMIEAAIVGRPVLGIEAPEFAGSQDGTLHYRHLLPENGGFLRVSSSFEAHVAQLAEVLRDPHATREQITRFVRSFVRPHGLDTPATGVLVEAIERFGAAPAPRPETTSRAARLLRSLLRPVAVVGQPLWPSPSGRKARGRARAGHRTPPAELKPVRVDPLLATAALAPVCAALIPVAAFIGAEMRGSTLLSYAPPANLAEAAALGLGSEVRRFMAAGQDPRAVYPVRPDAISSAITRATGLEAAVWGRSQRLVRMFDRMGLIDMPTRRHLACLAADVRSEDVRETLAAPDASSCEPEAAYELVRERSQ